MTRMEARISLIRNSLSDGRTRFKIWLFERGFISKYFLLQLVLIAAAGLGTIKSLVDLYRVVADLDIARVSVLSTIASIASFGLLIAMASVFFGGLNSIRRAQRNIFALDTIPCTIGEVQESDVIEYAILAYEKHKPPLILFGDPPDLEEMKKRYLNWWKTDPTALVAIRRRIYERPEEISESEIVGGFWIVGLTEAAYRQFQKNRKASSLKEAGSTVPTSSDKCHALQCLSVTAADTLGDIFSGQFGTSNIITYKLYDRLRVLCVENPNIKEIGAINARTDVTYSAKMFGFSELHDVSYTGDRIFWHTGAKSFVENTSRAHNRYQTWYRALFNQARRYFR
jgi:hypothetical protein